MAVSTVCPLCLNHISSANGKHHCENCNTTFSTGLGDAIIVESVGSIPKKDWVTQPD